MRENCMTESPGGTTQNNPKFTNYMPIDSSYKDQCTVMLSMFALVLESQWDGLYQK